MVKRSIEQEIRNKNFGTRNGNYGRNARGSRIRRHNSVDKEFLETLGNGKSTGQCVEGDNCSFRHDINKRGKVIQSNTSPNSFMQQDERHIDEVQGYHATPWLPTWLLSRSVETADLRCNERTRRQD